MSLSQKQHTRRRHSNHDRSKSMGIESDLELVQLVGSEPMLVNAMALSLEEPVGTEVHWN